MTDVGIRAASKTYRKVINKMAEVLRVEPEHTRRPSADYDTMLEIMDDESRERALEWYERGLRRGYIKAATDLANGKLSLEDGSLSCPEEIVVRVRVKFRGKIKGRRAFRFTPDELGLE